MCKRYDKVILQRPGSLPTSVDIYTLWLSSYYEDSCFHI